MKGIILRLAAAVAVATFLSTGTAAAGDIPALVASDNAVDAVSQVLPTALDPLLADTAVTDEQLAVAGVWIDNVPTLLSDPNMLIVDDDLAQCPNAPFQTINAAVTAALPGAKIRVCPGTYHEAVRILKADLTLQAPRHQGQATECKSPLAADSTQVAIVEYDASINGGNPSVGFQVEASNVTIEGFTVRPDPTKVSSNGKGIFTDRFHSGAVIRHNVLENNTQGVDVESNGQSETWVRENCARNNNLPGAAAGVGIYSDQGLANARIENNFITGHENAAVILDTFLTPPHDIQITHNTSEDDSSIVVFNSEDIVVSYNKATNPLGSAIFVFAVTDSEISFNHLVGGGDSNRGLSINNSSNLRIQSNKVTLFNNVGLRLANSSGNTVATNRIEQNGVAGLRATSTSTNNTIRENHMRGNGPPDCSDQSAGGGTAGTANFWINDRGDTEDRPGICKTKP